MSRRKYVCYCSKCRKDTIHEFVCKEETGAKRLFMGVVTLGLSELDNENVCQCTRCGNVNKN